MFSRHPAPFGAPPSEIVFDGIEPGAPVAQLLYHQHQSEISHFQGKARQNREISEQPGAHMQQALPDGGQLRYSYNNGQEIVHVKLSPKVVAAAEAQLTPRKPDVPIKPTLAIDVLFDTRLYAAGDIYAFTETSVYVPGSPGVPSYTDPDTITFDVDASYWTANYPSGAIESVDGGPTLHLAAPTFLVQYPVDLPTRPVGTKIDQTFILIKFVDDGFHDYGFGIGGTGAFTTRIVSKGGFHPAVPPTESRYDVTRHYTRNLYRFFDMLDVAGAIGDPEPDAPTQVPYIATSLGESSDARLIPCSKLPHAHAIARHLSASDDPAPPGFIGAGFLAQPTIPLTPGGASGKTVIDVYIASSNTSVHNTEATASRDAHFGADDPSFLYDATDILYARVRCREFADGDPVAVQVTVNADMMHQSTVPGAGDSGGVGGLGPPEYVPSVPARPFTWFFAARPTWSDSGNEPAQPEVRDARDQPTMGRLLIEQDFPGHPAAKLDPVQRKIYTAAEWPAGIAAMTQLCRIEWTPPDDVSKPGTATIS